MRQLRGLVSAVTFVAMIAGPTMAEDTIKIGLVNEATGPNAEAGVFTVNGAKLALE